MNEEVKVKDLIAALSQIPNQELFVLVKKHQYDKEFFYGHPDISVEDGEIIHASGKIWRYGPCVFLEGVWGRCRRSS